LRLFEALRAALDRKGDVERAGFTLADSWSYLGWLQDRPDFESQGHLLLKEWEITRERQGQPDRALLARYERELGGPAGLFGAIVADRRLIMGRDCTYSQDYRRRFMDDELLCILQNALLATERLFDELRPDVVVGFICVTLLDYLVYLFARQRGVRFLNLRPTRIGDRVIFGSLLNDPTPEFMQAYRQVQQKGSSFITEAKNYLQRVREQHGRYEGVIRVSSKPALKVNAARRRLWEAALHVIRNYRKYRRSIARDDNHVPHPLRALFFTAMANPWRARRTAALLKSRYIAPEALARMRYAFYPLHTEPEVSLLVYGRPFVNQIEIIRALALSLPVDMILVVKEHPWMVGKRSLRAYRKLLDIPRVHLASPDMEARDLVANAALVSVITGSIALEAAILGKPVLTFGDCPYNALPSSMVERCRDLRGLPDLLRNMLANHAVNEVALENYVAATWETSESINLYSTLLGKKAVHAERQASGDEEIEKLAAYFMRCVRESPAAISSQPGAAPW
jgi:hypothetical protein